MTLGGGEGKESRTGARQDFKCAVQGGSRHSWITGMPQIPLSALSTHKHLHHLPRCQKSTHLLLKGPVAGEIRPDNCDRSFYIFTGEIPAKNAMNSPFQ